MGERFDLWVGSNAGRVAFALWCLIVWRINMDVANYGISVYTAAVLIFGKRSERQDRKAVHAKLDDLECAIEEADSDNVRLEERPEHEIEAKRDGMG